MSSKIEKILQQQNIILFDEVCVLCNNWIRFLIKFDQKSTFKIASVQSPIGQQILAHYQMPLNHYDTMLTIYKGQLHTESSAFLKVMQHLGFPFSLLVTGFVIPNTARDFLYQMIARNRYRIFGKTDSCILPSAQNKAHFLEECLDD